MPAKDKDKKGGLGSRLHSVIKRVIKDKQAKAKAEEATTGAKAEGVIKAEKRLIVSKKELPKEEVK